MGCTHDVDYVFDVVVLVASDDVDIELLLLWLSLLLLSWL